MLILDPWMAPFRRFALECGVGSWAVSHSVSDLMGFTPRSVLLDLCWGHVNSYLQYRIM